MLITTQKTDLALKAKLFRGFGDPSRLGIIEALREGPRTVSEIISVTALSQSKVSNHLGCLRDCGLVRGERDGRHVTYHLSNDHIGDILTLAEAVLEDVAREIYECTRYNTPGL